MSWFFLALICITGWGCADLFYKLASDDKDSYSHLRIAVWVGFVMGICALMLLPLAESSFSPTALLQNAVKYSPASLGYIISMVIGYAGLRYLELSIVSPIQNASGALSSLCMMIYFISIGQITRIGERFSALNLTGTALIVIGVIALSAVEQKLSAAEQELSQEQRKYRFGALALMFPVLYCVFDTIGTAADGIILDESSGLGLGEIDVIILYGLTFFLAGLLIWLFLLWREKKPYNPFARSERPKMLAACCEEFGQVFYVYAMAANPMTAAPLVASYCIVSVLLSRLLLNEKLGHSRFACIAAVILGIILLGISEGLAEA